MKKATAKDIMISEFKTIRPDASVREAARLIFESGVRQTGYKPFGIMVVDEIGRLVGMISMFDLLYHLRPPFMNYEEESFGVWQGELDTYMDNLKGLLVEQVMSSPVLTVDATTDIMLVIDIMVKKKARRLPVVDGDKILGVVYLSDVFSHLFRSWLQP